MIGLHEGAGGGKIHYAAFEPGNTSGQGICHTFVNFYPLATGLYENNTSILAAWECKVKSNFILVGIGFCTDGNGKAIQYWSRDKQTDTGDSCKSRCEALPWCTGISFGLPKGFLAGRCHLHFADVIAPASPEAVWPNDGKWTLNVDSAPGTEITSATKWADNFNCYKKAPCKDDDAAVENAYGPGTTCAYWKSSGRCVDPESFGLKEYDPAQLCPVSCQLGCVTIITTTTTTTTTTMAALPECAWTTEPNCPVFCVGDTCAGELGKEACPDGMTPITNYTMCAEAAHSFDQSFEGSPSIVDGNCVWCRCATSIKFTNPGGYIPQQSKWICKKLPEAPPTCCSCITGNTFKDNEDGQPLSTNFTKVLPIDCATRTLPIQVVSYASGYSARELSLATGGYNELFTVPFTRTTPSYSTMSACSINPLDSVAYCIILIETTYYLIRMDNTQVEFVAKLKSDITGIYNAGSFGPSGTFYYMTSENSMVFTQRGLEETIGYPNASAPKLLDLTNEQGSQYNGWNNIKDSVAITGDLDKSGTAVEYVIGFTGEKVHIVKATGDETSYLSWTVLATSGYHNGWGGGFAFNGTVFFANNNGLGVYEIPLRGINLFGAPVEVVRINNAGKIEDGEKNNGMNCLSAVNPWLTPCASEGYREVAANKYGQCPEGAKLLSEVVTTTTNAPTEEKF